MAVQDILYQLQSSGLYEIALPFLLIFTIVFAILEKTKIFGIDKNNEPRSKINAVIAIILGLLIVNQFEIVDRLNLFLPKVSLFIVVAIMFLILLGVFGARVESGFSGVLLGLAAIVSLLVIYSVRASEFKDFWPFVLFGLVIFALVMGWMDKQKEPETYSPYGGLLGGE